MTNFIVYALPRSRTKWLSTYLTCKGHHCEHEMAPRMRSMDDIKSWLSIPNCGSAEPGAAGFWRIPYAINPKIKIATIRRNPEDVIKSFMNLKVGTDEGLLREYVYKLDRQLNMLEYRIPNVLSIDYNSLTNEKQCAALFEHCLEMPHDSNWFQIWDKTNIQMDMIFGVNYGIANATQITKMQNTAIYECQKLIKAKRRVRNGAITYQVEDFDQWYADFQHLFQEHLNQFDEDPFAFSQKNIQGFKDHETNGSLHILTARDSKGVGQGYMLFVMGQSLENSNKWVAVQNTFYATEVGILIKLERESINLLKQKGINQIYFTSDNRGIKNRLGLIHAKMGAKLNNQLWKIDLD